MGTQISRVRATLSVLIISCILYFIIGGILALFGWVCVENYAIAGGVVGGIASVLSLISLARPALSQGDLDTIESQSLRALADTSEKIKELEAARAATAQEIDTLELQKKEMQLLVQKASLSLFLREQRRLYEKRIQEEVAANRDLEGHLHELISIDQKLNALNEEIETDPNVDLVKEIIASAKRPADEIEDLFKEYPPLTRAILRGLSIVVKDLKDVMRAMVVR
jgi:hypothetical protein